MPESHEHIFLRNIAKSEKFTSTSTGGGASNIPERDRNIHANYLLSRFDTIWREQADQRHQREAISLPSREGTYLEFKSSANKDLITKSLEDTPKGIRLLNVRTIRNDNQEEIRATVYIPQGKESSFIRKIQDYTDDNKNSKKGNPRNANLVNSIEDIKLAIFDVYNRKNHFDNLAQSGAAWIAEKWKNEDVVEELRGLILKYQKEEISF